MVSDVLFFHSKYTKKLITALQNNSWNTVNITDWHLTVLRDAEVDFFI